jgi:hypothetical protein
MSWQQRLSEVGLTESTLPNMIKKAVNDLKAFQKEAAKINSQLESDSLSDRKREELEEAYDTLVESIESQEQVIEKKIDQWEKNKDGYAARGEALKAARMAKKGEKVQSQPQAQEPPQAPQGVVVTTPPAQNEPISVEAEEVKPTEKKSSGLGWLVLIGIVAIASLGAINLSKNE